MRKCKKLISFVLAFAMVINVFIGTDMTIKADTKTNIVYFDNAKTKWSTVCAYIWGTSLEKQTLKATKVEGNIYKLNIPAEYSNILFKNTESGWDKQTANTTVQTDDKNCFKPTSSSNKTGGTWYHYDEQVVVTASAVPTNTSEVTPTATLTITPEVTATAVSTDEPSIAPTNNPVGNVATVYYKRATNTSWTNAYAHYKINDVWTVSPGVAMEKVSAGYWKLSIDLGNASEAAVCFNNGNGTWDNNSKKNYTVYAGAYLVDQTTKKVTVMATQSPIGTNKPTATPTPSYKVIKISDYVPKASKKVVSKGSYKNVKWKIYDNGLLEVKGTGDMYDYNSRPAWTSYSYSAARIEVTGATHLNSLFSTMYDDSLKAVDLTKLDTSKVTTMEYMFDGCEGLRAVAFGKYSTSKVKKLTHMFFECYSLEYIIQGETIKIPKGEEEKYWNNLSFIDTSKVTNMLGVFESCNSLEYLNLSGWNTASVKSMVQLFSGCDKLKKININKWNVSNVEDMNGMFCGCESLENLNLNVWDTSKVKDMSRMFVCCDVSSLAIDEIDTSSVTDMSFMFDGCKNLTNVRFGGKFNTKNVVKMQEMFSGCGDLEAVDLSNMDASSLKDMSFIFSRCDKLHSVKFGGKFNTKNVEDMKGLFYECTSLRNIDLSDLDMSGATEIGSMFEKCINLKTINLSSIDTSNVTEMTGMFETCESLETIDLSNMDTSNVTDMGFTFAECKNLKNIKFGEKFDTKNVRRMQSMFYGCTALNNLDISMFDTSNVEDMREMFRGCSNLIEIKFGPVQLDKIKLCYYMFAECGNLENLDFGGKTYYLKLPEFNCSNMYDGCDKLKDRPIIAI